MGTSTPENDQPAPERETPPADSAPQWALDLKRTIEELPGRLRATVSDDDKSGIAEAVHGLFERSGAFEPAKPAEEEQQTESETTPPETEPTHTEQPPKKTGRFASFASRFSGEG